MALLPVVTYPKYGTKIKVKVLVFIKKDHLSKLLMSGVPSISMLQTSPPPYTSILKFYLLSSE